MQAGVDDFIDKPLRKPVLEAKLQFLHHLSRQRRALQAKITELEALTAEVKRMTLCDGLTGIANRRHFDAELIREWRRSCRAGSTLSLCLVDIDQFAAFNELYGQLDGDDCLVRSAQALLSSMRRAGDLVARYDADCFAVLLPDTDTESVSACAERLRNAIRALRIPHAGAKTGQITASVGVASLGPASASKPDELLQLAERALAAMQAAAT
jgi:diguanylate cyclase (GGDEF)-like protein